MFHQGGLATGSGIQHLGRYENPGGLIKSAGALGERIISDLGFYHCFGEKTRAFFGEAFFGVSQQT
jgi:hypothetical protein